MFICNSFVPPPPPFLQSSLSMQLQYKLPALLRQKAVKLIVVDSLAALFRVEFTGSQASQRAYLLRSFGAQLRRLSDTFSLPVVCVNQVNTQPHTKTNVYIFVEAVLQTDV